VKYRTEIDGLRAIAVVLVVLYHAEIVLLGRSLFPGGFIGVDVFFVISGYLIARLVFSEIQDTGKLNIVHFYERRARRILPALAVVLLAALPVANLVLLPSRLVEFSLSSISTTFFFSNIFFFFSTTEYGAEASLLKPLLHTWSLSVEEQFYLVFPALALVLTRFKQRSWVPILVVLFMASLTLADFQTPRNPDLGFYSPLTRSWELLAGVLLAQFEPLRKAAGQQPWAPALATLGIMLILYAAMLFDFDTVHPAIPTLIPVIGTSLVIFFGRSDDFAGWLLSWKPVTYVGLISYSLYLWHFPVFAFERLYFAEWNAGLAIGGIVLAALGATLSHRFVETPFRDRRAVATRSFVVIMLGAFFIILSAAAFTIFRDGNPERTNDPSKATGAGSLLASRNFDVSANYEFDNALLKQNTLTYYRTKSDELPDASKLNFLILGNSHARDIYNAFRQNADLFPEFNFAVRFSELGCFYDDPSSVEEFKNSLKFANADIVLVSPMWSTTRQCSLNDRTKPTKSDVEGWLVIYDTLVEAGKVVVVTGQNAMFDTDQTRTLADRFMAETDLEAFTSTNDLSVAMNRYMYTVRRSARPWTAEKFKSIEDGLRSSGAIYLSKQALVCDDFKQSCLALTEDGYKTYWDGTHYTLEGAKLFGEIIYRTEWLAPVYRELTRRGLLEP